MARTRHVGITLALLHRMVCNDPGQQILTTNGRPLPQKEALDEIARLQAAGYEVFPPCEHTDSRGCCLGHDA